jgi:hypothetical protein
MLVYSCLTSSRNGSTWASACSCVTRISTGLCQSEQHETPTTLTLCARKPSMRTLMHTKAFSSFSILSSLIINSMTCASYGRKSSLRGNRWRKLSKACRKRYETLVSECCRHQSWTRRSDTPWRGRTCSAFSLMKMMDLESPRMVINTGMKTARYFS